MALAPASSNVDVESAIIWVKMRAAVIHKITGVNRSELESEGLQVLARCLVGYDGSASFQTYLYSALNSELYRFARRYSRLVATCTIAEDCEDELTHTITPYTHVEWRDSLAKLSEDARCVVDVVLNKGDEFALTVAKSNHKQEVQSACREHCVRMMGMSERRYWQATAEIRKLLYRRKNESKTSAAAGSGRCRYLRYRNDSHLCKANA